MFALLLSLATVAGVAAAASETPASLCGGSDLSRGNAAMTLRFLNAPADLHSPYVSVQARSEDGSYSLSVGYRPTEQGLGKPHIVHVAALVPFASDAEARPLRLEWREPGGAWSNPFHWSTPQRFFPNEEARFRTNYRLGQGEPFPHGAEVLDNVAEGVRYEFRSLDKAGDVVSTGTTDYPPQQVIEEMYVAARRQAVARLRPCGAGQAPAVTIVPSP